MAKFPMASMKAGCCLAGLLIYLKLSPWTNIYRRRGFWLYFQSGWAFVVPTAVRASCRWLSISGSGGSGVVCLV